MVRIVAGLVVLMIGPAVHAQTKVASGDDMIQKYLSAETDKLNRKFLDGAKDVAEWKQKLPRLKQEFLYMLGLWPLPEKTPLRATVTGSFEAHGVVVENLHYQSKPGLYVTGNYYRPKTLKPGVKLPAILYVCGHSNMGRAGNKAAFQDHGFWFANNGYVCLVVDTLQLAEIPGVHHGTYGRPWLHLSAYGIKDKQALENRFWWHATGYTPAGVESWNGIRGIDYLVSRPEVDADKIGVTGISGGGAATFWVACADERVKVAVPVSGMSDLESYVKNKVVNGHCDCMFLYNAYQWDWTTIAALFAPKPLLFANSDNDPIFPMDGNRRIMVKLRELYKMYGQPELVDDYVSVGGHAYRPDLRVVIFKFFNTHLKGDKTTPVEDSEKYTAVDKKKLRVFPDDNFPKDAINDRIDETFVPPAKVAWPEKGKFIAWQAELLKKLREECFQPFPAQLPVGKHSVVANNPVLVERVETEGPVGVRVMSTFGGQDTKMGQVVILDDNDPQDGLKGPEWGKPYWRDVYGGQYLFPRGVHWTWNQKSPPNTVARSLVLLGRTVDQGRVWDIVSSVKAIDAELKRGGLKDKKVSRVVGRGASGILGAYAALLEPGLEEVVVINPPKSHLEGPYFLNVLRVLDIPEALGLLAPRKLTIVGGGDAVFERTAEIYRLAGAADKLIRK